MARSINAPPNSPLGSIYRDTLTQFLNSFYTEHDTRVLAYPASRKKGWRAMSFTEDELQSFHSILEERLALSRREMEHTLDQHLTALNREMEQRFLVAQQEMMRSFALKLTEQQNELNAM